MKKQIHENVCKPPNSTPFPIPFSRALA